MKQMPDLTNYEQLQIQARRFVVIKEGGGVAYRCVTQPNPAGGLGAV